MENVILCISHTNQNKVDLHNTHKSSASIQLRLCSHQCLSLSLFLPHSWLNTVVHVPRMVWQCRWHCAYVLFPWMGALKRDSLNCLCLKFKCVLNTVMSLPRADAVQSQIKSILILWETPIKKKYHELWIWKILPVSVWKAWCLLKVNGFLSPCSLSVSFSHTATISALSLPGELPLGPSPVSLRETLVPEQKNKSDSFPHKHTRFKRHAWRAEVKDFVV